MRTNPLCYKKLWQRKKKYEAVFDKFNHVIQYKQTRNEQDGTDLFGARLLLP